MNLLTSGSVSSPHVNSKHLAYVTQQAIPGDQVVYRMAFQNNVLCQWASLKALRTPYATDMLFKATKEPMGTADRRHFVYRRMSRAKSRQNVFALDQWSAR